MEGHADGHRSTRLIRESLLLVGLIVLGILFFLPVRNNGFWHPQDYGYLLQALHTDQSLRNIFAIDTTNSFQPLVNLVFYLEFRLFGLAAWNYYLFNIIVHSLNAFLVYLLVRTLLRDRSVALLSSLLFVFAVGNYGKAVMVVSGIGDLLITMLTLLTMWFYVRNELDDRGKLSTANFMLCVLFLMLCLLSKATTFSLLGCMLAFNMFFRQQTQRRLFDRNFVILVAFAMVVLFLKLSLLPTIPGATDLSILSWSLPRNLASYLVRMVFPIQYSALVGDSTSIVRLLYRFVSEIRILIFLCILSYSVFGFIFGNRVIRFFIAWTYITVAPFCFFKFPADWLNIRYLYLVSVGFSMIIASGTILAARLLYQKPWRRALPLIIPLAFVILSRFIVGYLDQSYETKENAPNIESSKRAFYEVYEKR